MPMAISECKREILFTYHMNIQFWYGILGEMFEETNGFRECAEIKRTMNGISYIIAWTSYDFSWHIDEV